MHYKNKVVWITGASSGIGEALVYEFDKQQALLVISARRVEELERVKAKCAHPENIFILPLDLADRNSFAEKVASVIKHYNHIDLIINNAGISQRSLAKDTTVEVDQQLMEINYLGTVALTKTILPYYIQRHAGHIAVIRQPGG